MRKSSAALSPRELDLGPICISDGTFRESTTGPCFTSSSIFDQSFPCPCLTKREILKHQCDEHKSEFVFYMDKIGVKMAELGRLHFYSNELKSYGTVRVELMDHMPIKFIDSEEESEKDLGTRESYHCNKADCVHRSSFDLYLKKQTAIWEYKSHCKLVRSKQIILIASSFLFCF